MSTILKILCLALLISATIPKFAIAEPYIAPLEVKQVSIVIEPVKPITPLLAIELYSDTYGADKRLLESMAKCESGLNPKAVGDYGRARNIMQYHKGTFDSFAKLMGEKLNYNSYADQAKLTAWISVNHPDKLRHWTSYRALKNGGTYKFYSKLLKKNYTVKCKLVG